MVFIMMLLNLLFIVLLYPVVFLSSHDFLIEVFAVFLWQGMVFWSSATSGSSPDGSFLLTLVVLDGLFSLEKAVLLFAK